MTITRTRMPEPWEERLGPEKLYILERLRGLDPDAWLMLARWYRERLAPPEAPCHGDRGAYRGEHD